MQGLGKDFLHRSSELKDLPKKKCANLTEKARKGKKASKLPEKRTLRPKDKTGKRNLRKLGRRRGRRGEGGQCCFCLTGKSGKEKGGGGMAWLRGGLANLWGGATGPGVAAVPIKGG